MRPHSPTKYPQMIFLKRSIFPIKFLLSKEPGEDPLITSEQQNLYTNNFRASTISKVNHRTKSVKINFNNITHKNLNKIMIIKDKFKIGNLMRNNYN